MLIYQYWHVHLLTSGHGVSAGDEGVAKSGVHDAGGAQAKSPAHPPPLLQHDLLAEPHHTLHGDLVPLTERGVKH
jgi:hypothetical protein|uniref:Uncharacterized protein n=1 Tax=Zea mays TaxID=4577 RepID=B7ZZE3_MAIZE|nr:unknown [Zea mays]